MGTRASGAVEEVVDDLPIARGAWLPIDAAAELLDLDVAQIRQSIADGFVEVRVVEGIEFVPAHQLRVAERSGD